MVEKWMQKAFRPKTKGRLHRQLGYSPDATLPPGLLNQIRNAKVGSTVRGHPVTPLLKRRVNLALNARRR